LVNQLAHSLFERLLLMKKSLIALCLVPVLAVAQQCVLQEKTVSRGVVVIAERSDVRAEVVPGFSGGRNCLVNFRARIGADWHTAFGEYEWPGDRPRSEACAVALKRAEDAVRERVGRSQVMSEKMLVCRDNPDLETMRQTNPGTVGNLAQFRPHPDRPREFWHNGAPCRYFLDSALVQNDIRTFEGVICKIHDSKWVVVDKF
jgi:hypothetical protein